MNKKEHFEKINRWFEFSKKQDIKRVNYKTVFDTIIQKLGIICPPMLFWSFFQVTVVWGICFIFGMLICVKIFLSFELIFAIMQQVPFVVIPFVITGALMGAGIAANYRNIKKKNLLTKWSEFNSN